MIKTFLTATVIYLSTSIDEIPVLFMLYTKTENRGKGKTITAAYFLGTFLLIALGFLGAFGLIQIPVKWAVGLIGLIPFVLGIKIFKKGEEEEEEEKAIASAGKHKTLLAQVLVITLALGADDLGVYIPVFTTVNIGEMLEMLLVFAFGTAVLCFISYRLTKIDVLTKFIEKQERYITGIVFIIIGLLVLIDCNTVTGIIKLIRK